MLNRPEIRLLFGRGGTGKTWRALELVGPRPALIHDITNQPKLATNAAVCDDPAHLVDLMAGGKARRICWRGYNTMGEDAFEWGNRVAWAAGGRVVFWDEVDFLMPPTRTPPHAYRLINAGRHRDCTIIATARRPYAMSRHLTAAATAVECFTVTGRRDVEYLAEFFDDQAPAVRTLGAGEAMVWTDRDGAARKNIFTP